MALEKWRGKGGGRRRKRKKIRNVRIYTVYFFFTKIKVCYTIFHNNSDTNCHNPALGRNNSIPKPDIRFHFRKTLKKMKSVCIPPTEAAAFPHPSPSPSSSSLSYSQILWQLFLLCPSFFLNLPLSRMRFDKFCDCFLQPLLLPLTLFSGVTNLIVSVNVFSMPAALL